ncbi:carbonic anhydrase [Leifsonia xyli subsp. cynodontis DSM 46306]|jgi:hypothetical protein|uniref:Uncharacterized protein n=1 Tax=Leifsonia xyli subsp. cynodontis DSM 46306 TaxID=1389489 RepID=U3P7M8_LEIXC|nr:carbonic anhydrase [Leifsonia xyli subsp. cynodontis DSM 46306]
MSGTTTQTIATRTATISRMTVTIAHARFIPRRWNHRTSGSRPTVANIARNTEKMIERRP